MGTSRRLRTGLVVVVVLACALLGLRGALADDTGWKNPSANVADVGNGFESNPTYAYLDGAPGAASDVDGNSHRYYNYSFGVPACAIIDGIEVRLDWWVSDPADWNNMDVELSWDGGTTWTAAKTDTTTSTVEHTGYLGGPTDTWGRAWTADELSNANFRLRVANSTSG